MQRATSRIIQCRSAKNCSFYRCHLRLASRDTHVKTSNFTVWYKSVLASVDGSPLYKNYKTIKTGVRVWLPLLSSRSPVEVMSSRLLLRLYSLLTKLNNQVSLGYFSYRLWGLCYPSFTGFNSRL